MSINILLHHILIELDDAIEADETYRRAKALGIELALDKREQQAVEYGTVVKVGPTAFVDYGRGPDILQIGDRVTFARYSGKKVKDSDNKEYVVVNDSDVLAVIK